MRAWMRIAIAGLVIVGVVVLAVSVRGGDAGPIPPEHGVPQPAGASPTYDY